MIGHSAERATGKDAMEAVYWHAHLSHHIKKVAADTPYTNLYRITCIMPPNVNISSPPSVITSTTTISTTCAGGITSNMRMGGDNIPQYIPPWQEVILGCWRKGIGYWCPDNYMMGYGTNQHNNQLIWYIRGIKAVGPAHSTALGDEITGDDISCCGGGFWVMIHNNILCYEV